ncbi:MAG TPA: hypothetical protein VFR91_05180 [Dyella sp.]|nr:hypothetical protein [Dyella sp.]
MRRQSKIRWSLLLAGVLLVACGAVFGGRWLAGDLVGAESFRSIPPGPDGIAWVACRGTLAAQSSGAVTDDAQAFCQHVAEQLCHGPATYLDLGAGAPQANRFRERFRCGTGGAGSGNR